MKKLIAAGILAIFATVPVVTAHEAKAEGFSLFGKPVLAQALAYAPEPSDDERFDEIIEEEWEHELNDAWLGMPAHDANGTMVGFVEDAFLDAEGNVSELLVSLNGKNFAVFVDGSLAELTNTEVAISMSGHSIAMLERAEGFELVQR